MFNNIHSVFNGLGSTDINCNDKTKTQVPRVYPRVLLYKSLTHVTSHNMNKYKYKSVIVNHDAQYIEQNN
jgi:hypothetical protein